MTDIPKPKTEWPDGIERVLDGAVIRYGGASRHGGGLHNSMWVHETPREVEALRKQATEDEPMLELHHHADPEVAVYVNKYYIVAIDARWKEIDH